jgi:outer membrane protein assembly factor BamD
LPLFLAVLGAAFACATQTRGIVPAGTSEPDKFLFDKGNDAFQAKRWLASREYYKQVVESYTQSPLRPDAKLGVGDTYLAEGGSENLVLAINEFREFLSFYPTNRRADYAQYKLGIAHARQMRPAQRDQSETRDAVREFRTFVQRYPDSPLLPEVKTKLREALDRLGEADYEVGLYYFRARWYPGAILRFTTLLKSDPEFTSRDAVYFYLAESYLKEKRNAQALPYYDKLVNEFQKSEHLLDAQKRIVALKAQAANKS